MRMLRDFKTKIDTSNLGFLFIYFDSKADITLFKKFIR